MYHIARRVRATAADACILNLMFPAPYFISHFIGYDLPTQFLQ